MPVPVFQFQFRITYNGSVNIEGANEAAARQIFNQLQVANLLTFCGQAGLTVIQINPVNTDPDNYNP